MIFLFEQNSEPANYTSVYDFELPGVWNAGQSVTGRRASVELLITSSIVGFVAGRATHVRAHQAPDEDSNAINLLRDVRSGNFHGRDLEAIEPFFDFQERQ